MNWSKRLVAASAISLVGLVAVGILGGYTIYSQNRTTVQTLTLSRLRSDTAGKVQVAILSMGKAQTQIILAHDPSRIREAAISAIRASSILDESVQRLDAALPGNSKVAQLSFLLKKIEPIKMRVIRAAKENNDAAALHESDSMQFDMARIEQLAGELSEEENQGLLLAVVNQGKQSRSTLRLLGTMVLICVVLSVLAGLELRARTLDLARARSESELFINFVPSILIGIDENGCINRWNNAAATVFGLSRAEVEGKSLEQCGIRWLRGFAEEIRSWPHSTESRHYDDLSFERAAEHRFLTLTVNPIRFENGREAEFLITGADVTERRSLEEELRQAHKLEAIGQLAAGVAHEINTPVQYVADNTRFVKESWIAVEGLLELSRELAADEASAANRDFRKLWDEVDIDFLKQEVPSAIAHCLEGLERIAKIVRAMKEFSHPGSATMQPIDINRAIELTVTVASSEWRHVAEVKTEFDPALPPILCNAGEFNQVILNLLINAAHAVADAAKLRGNGKGIIILKTRSEGEWAEIQIRDSGVGIPKEIEGRVFEPFFTTKEVGKGTGQGLALAHTVIVKKHGGKIWFESIPGKGTTFFLRLPLEQRAGASA